jgi:beta-amyrin synthase
MPDGSWYGNWGVCFIYSTWFALVGLAAAGKTYSNNQAMRRGVDFLLRVQSPDGGWGESYLACPNKVIGFISAIELCLDKRENTLIKY